MTNVALLVVVLILAALDATWWFFRFREMRRRLDQMEADIDALLKRLS